MSSKHGYWWLLRMKHQGTKKICWNTNHSTNTVTILRVSLTNQAISIEDRPWPHRYTLFSFLRRFFHHSPTRLSLHTPKNPESAWQFVNPHTPIPRRESWQRRDRGPSQMANRYSGPSSIAKHTISEAYTHMFSTLQQSHKLYDINGNSDLSKRM